MGNLYSYLRPTRGAIVDPEEPLSHETETSKAPMFNREEILQAHCDSVTGKLANYALEFAVLGYLDAAKDLVTLLNDYSFYHSAEITLKPLWLAWAEIDSWPAKEHERVDESVDDLAKQYSDSFFDRRHSPKKTEATFTNDAEGLVQLLRAADGVNPMFADATSGFMAAGRSRALVRALDLRLALAEQELAVASASSTTEKAAVPHDHLPTVEDILGRIAARLHCSSQVRYLAQSARAWKILRNGALAKAVGVQDGKVVQLAKEVKDVFFDRFRNGRQILAADPMKDLIRAVSDTTQTYLGTEEVRDDVGAPDGPPESLIRPGATTEKIAELEGKLGVKLPEDYKEFLSLSDGLGSSWGGILMEPGLHPISDVRWEDDKEYFTDLRLEILPFSVFPTCREFPGLAVVDNWPVVGRSIQIGEQDTDTVWLLLPGTVAKVRDAYLRIVDSEEAPERLKATVMNAVNSFAGSRQNFEKLDWCVLDWKSGGCALMIAYPSFKEFMADKARRSGTDYWAGDEREKMCFAYGCR